MKCCDGSEPAGSLLAAVESWGEYANPDTILELLQDWTWLPQYVHELATFPNGKHEDQADSTSQVLDWMKSFLFEPGIVTYYRQEAEKRKAEQQRTEPDPPRALPWSGTTARME